MFWCENPLFSALSLDPNFRKFGLDEVLLPLTTLVCGGQASDNPLFLPVVDQVAI